MKLRDLYSFLFCVVVPPGIEPGTQGFSVLCSLAALKDSLGSSSFNATN